MLDEANPSFLDDEKTIINLDKVDMLGGTLARFYRSQYCPYNITPDPNMQFCLRNLYFIETALIEQFSQKKKPK